MKKTIAFVTKLIKLRGISRAFIIATALISAIIIFVTIYASQVGNFVISVSNNEYEIYVSETPDFADPQSVLTAPTVKEMVDTTITRIDVNHIINTDGSSNELYNARTYIGYTFYLKSYTPRMINYNIRMSIDAVTKGIDAATWVMIIENKDDNEVRTTYAKAQTKGDQIGLPETCLEEDGITAVPFLSNTTIFDYNVLDLRADEVVKYTVIMWLEGNDADCVDDVLGGTIRMTLSFYAY